MLFQHVWGLFRDPASEWQAIRAADYSPSSVYGAHTFIMAAIPAVSGYIGTTRVGWQIGTGDPVMLTTDSALQISIAYFVAMLVGVYVLGIATRWMHATYCEESAEKGTPSLGNCIALISYTATPVFLVGVIELFPILWLNMILGLPALAYSVYLFYVGVPSMLSVSKERGFLFASAVLGFGMVAFVALLVLTALLWGFGLQPEFTS